MTADEMQLFYAACLIGSCVLLGCWYARSNKR